MRRIWSRLRRLGWKWRVLALVVVIVIAVVVLTPSIYYLLRARDVPDYSDIQPTATMAYLVSYDSGDGVVNEARYTLMVAEVDVPVGSDTCFYTVTVMKPLPQRKVNAIIVGSTTVTLATDEIWRSQEDLRIIKQKAMQINLPIVNTAITESTYSGYEGYPGWPYSLGDSWTYDVHRITDTSLQPNWTDNFRADVVADDEVFAVGDKEYECYKVVHTLVDTENSTPGGGGVGSTRIEYWATDGAYIAPVKVESTVSYLGTEIFIIDESGEDIDHGQGEITGEVTQDSAILQSRLTLKDDPLEGVAGVARFEISTDPDFDESSLTEWLIAKPQNDFVVETKVTGLESGTLYYYRLLYGTRTDSLKQGPACTFRTLDSPDVER